MTDNYDPEAWWCCVEPVYWDKGTSDHVPQYTIMQAKDIVTLMRKNFPERDHYEEAGIALHDWVVVHWAWQTAEPKKLESVT